MKKNINPFRKFNQSGFSHIEIFLLIIFVAVIAFVGDRVLTHSHADIVASSSSLPLCPTIPTPTQACRPLIGASAFGNQGTPTEITNHRAPGSDSASQYNYLEAMVKTSVGPNFHFNIFRDYHCVYNGAPCTVADSSITNTERNYASKGYDLNINWVPSPNWSAYPAVGQVSQLQSQNPTLYNEIVQTADSMKSIAPAPIYLTVWHEMNLHVTDSGVASCNADGGSGGVNGIGTPRQFINAWQDIHTIFKQQGVANVVWDMNYAGGSHSCLAPLMWPGDSYVDYVTWDTYSRGNTFANSAGNFYTDLTNENGQNDAYNNPADFESKPWGIGEFGTCKQPSGGISEPSYFSSMQDTYAANTYPRIHRYEIYANNAEGNGSGCLSDYETDPSNPSSNNGPYSYAKQMAVNNFFGAVFNSGGGVPHPTINSYTINPSTVVEGNTATLNWNVSNSTDCSVSPGGPSHSAATSWTTPRLTNTGTSNYTLTCTNSAGSASKSVAVTVTGPTVSISAPTNNATVSGLVPIDANGSSNVVKSQVVWDSSHVIRNVTTTSVDQYGWGAQWNSQNAPNGKHTVTVTVWDASGNSKSATVSVTVKN